MNIASTDEDRARAEFSGADGGDMPLWRERDVHVWSAWLDEPDPSSDEALLSPDELARADNYRFERDRTRFVVGRARLRRILADYTGRAAAELRFTTGRYGKPHLVQEPGEEPLYFNVTHADALALYALSRTGEVGVDVEYVREIPDWRLIAENFFSPEERDELNALDASQRSLGFLAIWTRREALLKALGEGLIGESQGRATARDRDLLVQAVDTAPGYLGALATGFKPGRILSLTWSGAPRVTSAATVET